MTIKTSAFYSISFFFIFCWWMVAYKNHEADEPKKSIPILTEQDRRIKTSGVKIELIPRETLVKALQGDIGLMGELILMWDMDAQILQFDEASPATPYKRLEASKLIECQKLVRMLSTKEQPLWKYSEDVIVDDLGTPFDLSYIRERFFPQTYMAADILLAIKNTDCIAALPKGFKNQEHLFPKSLTKDIPIEFDRYAAEILSTLDPKVAFVSKDFSDHYALTLLKAQGLDLFFVPPVHTVDDLCKAIRDIGDMSAEGLKARVLSTFMEALFLSLDNWREANKLLDNTPKILTLSFYNRFFLPGTKSLTDHFLKRMGIDNFSSIMPSDSRVDSFSIPISEEEIAYFNPDLLIILTDSPNEIQSIMQKRPFLKIVNAKLRDSIAYISEKVQISPSQAMGLAYYDLNASLIKLKEQ